MPADAFHPGNSLRSQPTRASARGAFASRSPAPIAAPMRRGSALVANHAWIFALDVFCGLNLRSAAGIPSTYRAGRGQTGSSAGSSPITKSSSSPEARAPGISHTPTRGSPSMTTPSGSNTSGSRTPVLRRVSEMDCHRASGSSLPSTRMPTARRPETFISGTIALRSAGNPRLFRIANAGASAWRRQRCRTTSSSSAPSTSKMRSGGRSSRAMRLPDLDTLLGGGLELLLRIRYGSNPSCLPFEPDENAIDAAEP